MLDTGLMQALIGDGTRKPLGFPVSLNRSHPIAPDRHCFVFNEGAGKQVRNLARPNEVGVFNTSGEVVSWQVVAGRLGVDFANAQGTSNQTAIINLPPWGQTPAGTIVCGWCSDTEDTANFGIFFGHTDTSSARIYLAQDGTSWNYRLGSGTQRIVSKVKGVGEYVVVALAWADGVASLYEDAVDLSTSAYSGTPGSNNDVSALGGSTNASFTADGKMFFGYSWTRKLSHAAISEISRRPYQFLVPALPVWGKAAGGAPVASPFQPPSGLSLMGVGA